MEPQFMLARTIGWLRPVVYIVLLIACIMAHRRSGSRAAVWLGAAAAAMLVCLFLELAVGRLVPGFLSTGGQAVRAMGLILGGTAALVGGVLLLQEQKRADAEHLAAEVASAMEPDPAPVSDADAGGGAGDAD
jgi:hypothetical protein